MVIIDGILVVVFVTINAGEDAEVRTVVVTIGTGVPFSIVRSTIDREVLLIVVERRWFPPAFTMAFCTIRREPGCCMVRVRRSIVVAHVAGTACRRRSGISIRMTLDARGRGVRAMQREVRVVVIEIGVAP